MKRLVVSRAARADLRSIARYSTREWGTARGRRYMAALRERFALLRRRPEIGAERQDVATQYRSTLVGRHLIFYRVEGPDVVVVRVLHQRMDIRLHIPDRMRD